MGKHRPGGIGRTRKGCSVVTTRSRRPFWLLVGLALLAGALAIASAPPAAAGALAASSAGPAPARSGAPPQPEQDPCLHCHVAGGSAAIWAPTARWTLFGVAGTVFAFGVYRSASVWRTRRPWRPLRTRLLAWLDARYHYRAPLAAVLAKPVPAAARRWWYCLGGITAFLFGLQAVTGILLAFYYQPTPDAAYASVAYIEQEVRFGAAVRAIHHWAANGMIVLCVAHMLRVYVLGAYRAPRELNWVSGVVLLLLTLVFGFTGYLLPWDQRAFWATTVGSEIAGAVPIVGDLVLVLLRVGWDVGALTLARFYALHVLIFPLSTVTLMGLHFVMVRRLGIAQAL
jgi:hypothetical protein